MNDQRLSGRFIFLDAIRGIAAVAIALFHFNNPYVSYTHREFNALLPDAVLAVWKHFDVGVDLFFLISGFVIAHSLWGKRITLGFVGNFIARFMTRLSPPYWTVLFLTMGWPYLVFPTYLRDPPFFASFGGWTGLLINTFYLPDLLGWPRMVPVAWTIFLEVQFYLAYIALLWIGDLCGRSSAKLARVVVSTLFAVLLLSSLAYWFHFGAMNFAAKWWTFAIGATTYTALRLRRPVWALPTIATLLGVAAIALHDGRCGVVAVFSLAIFVAATLGKLQTWLDVPPLRYLGRISYSLFLVHIPIGIGTQGIVQRFGDGSSISVVTSVVGALFMSLLFADLLNRAVEMPAARLSQKLRRH